MAWSIPMTSKPIATTWDRTSVEHLSFALSDEQPLQFHFATHRTRSTTLRDMHCELEVGFLVSGRMERQYEGWTTSLGPGDVWFCGTWEPHGYRVLTTPCEVGVFVVSQAFLARLSLTESPPYDWRAPFAARAQDRPQATGAFVREVLDLAGRMKRSALSDAPRSALWQRLALQELLLIATRHWAAPPTAARARRDPLSLVGPALRMVSQARRFVPVEQAAAACTMSRNAFSRHFRAAMGIDFGDFALRTRLKGAAAQIVSSEEPVKAIAYEWGFSDQSHLHHWFRRSFDCTPTQYRERAAPLYVTQPHDY
jgi:AraC-like DNA-binding protein